MEHRQVSLTFFFYLATAPYNMGILVLQPGIEPVPLALAVLS